MTLDTLVAVIGLAVAAYQLMPRARQLDLGVRFRPTDWLLLILGGIGIGYLQFYSFFAAFGLTPRLGLSRWNLTPERASFVLLLLTVSVVGMHLRFSRLSRRAVPRLYALMEELLWNQNYAEAAHVVDRHLERLSRLAGTDSWRKRVRRWIAPSPAEYLEELAPLRLNADTVAAARRPHRIRAVARKLASPLVRYLPQTATGREGAEQLLSRIQRSREFVEAVAKGRPYLAFKLLATPNRDMFEFLKHYMRALLADSGSVLHRELRDNPGAGHGRAAQFSSGEPLLSYFFNDPHVSERLSIYKPVGDAANEELLALRREHDSDPNNLTADDHFREDGCWDSPLYAAIVFFDLMVTATLFGRIRHHMWLLYYEVLTTRMIENHDPRDRHTPSDSFYETRYTYFIYEMVSRCRDWILAVERLTDDAELFNIQNNDEYENHNIPKSAIICLARILLDVLTSSKLSESYKSRMSHLVFDTYFRLRRLNQTVFAEVLAKALRRGDPFDAEQDAAYRAALRTAYGTFDKIPHMMHSIRGGRAEDPLRDFEAIVFNQQPAA
ncbi:MAG: hypothetical protein JO197_09950 [Acidobacteria bacterium]|nr:hypothetical protein [Acidobacteriota bacterium]MBV9477417.1 hypothetical protein [Acidobacteriota bacterium]